MTVILLLHFLAIFKSKNTDIKKTDLQKPPVAYDNEDTSILQKDNSHAELNHTETKIKPKLQVNIPDNLKNIGYLKEKYPNSKNKFFQVLNNQYKKIDDCNFTEDITIHDIENLIQYYTTNIGKNVLPQYNTFGTNLCSINSSFIMAVNIMAKKPDVIVNLINTNREVKSMDIDFTKEINNPKEVFNIYPRFVANWLYIWIKYLYNQDMLVLTQHIMLFIYYTLRVNKTDSFHECIPDNNFTNIFDISQSVQPDIINNLLLCPVYEPEILFNTYKVNQLFIRLQPWLPYQKNYEFKKEIFYWTMLSYLKILIQFNLLDQNIFQNNANSNNDNITDLYNAYYEKLYGNNKDDSEAAEETNEEKVKIYNEHLNHEFIQKCDDIFDNINIDVIYTLHVNIIKANKYNQKDELCNLNILPTQQINPPQQDVKVDFKNIDNFAQNQELENIVINFGKFSQDYKAINTKEFDANLLSYIKEESVLLTELNDISCNMLVFLAIKAKYKKSIDIKKYLGGKDFECHKDESFIYALYIDNQLKTINNGSLIGYLYNSGNVHFTSAIVHKNVLFTNDSGVIQKEEFSNQKIFDKIDNTYDNAIYLYFME